MFEGYCTTQTLRHRSAGFVCFPGAGMHYDALGLLLISLSSHFTLPCGCCRDPGQRFSWCPGAGAKDGTASAVRALGPRATALESHRTTDPERTTIRVNGKVLLPPAP